MPEKPPDDLIPLSEAAHAAGVVASTLYRWHVAGLITLYKRRARTLVRRSDIERVLRPRSIEESRTA
jgi:hypothetical protein